MPLARACSDDFSPITTSSCSLARLCPGLEAMALDIGLAQSEGFSRCGDRNLRGLRVAGERCFLRDPKGVDCGA